VERLDLRHPPREAQRPPRIQCALFDAPSFPRLNGPEPMAMM
jgi:hypothetical protein